MALEPYTRVIPRDPRMTPVSTGLGGRGVNPAASSAIQKALAYYAEGGGYGKGTEAALERGRTKAVTSGAQSLVSAGLAGTTMMAGLGKKFEEEVGMPTRARVEETRAQAMSSLEMAKAQIIQGATESDRSRALQRYLAELQSTSTPQRPTVTARPTATVAQPTQKPYEDVAYDPIISGGSSGGRRSVGAYSDNAWVKNQEWQAEELEKLYQGGWTG